MSMTTTTGKDLPRYWVNLPKREMNMLRSAFNCVCEDITDLLINNPVWRNHCLGCNPDLSFHLGGTRIRTEMDRYNLQRWNELSKKSD